VGSGLSSAIRKLAHFNKAKCSAAGHTAVFDLVNVWHRLAEEATRLEAERRLADCNPRGGHIQEERIHIRFSKTIGNIA